MRKLKMLLSLIIVFLLSTLLFSEEESIDDIILKFENKLDEHFESYKINPRENLTKLGGGWVKEQYCLAENYSYDVQKTNSLISPFQGICEFALTRSYTKYHKTREGALKDNNFIKSDLKLHLHKYLYKKGKWIVSERKHKGYSGWYDCNEIIQSGENKNQTNIFGCWEFNF